tara:strand:+ start:250 stop:450 length:201 start_codon:yes stop_codon:yes gene_type:complete
MDSDTALEHIFINFSKRTVKLMDEEGYENEVSWKFDSEGSNGFAETIKNISESLDSDMVTYCFATA